MKPIYTPPMGWNSWNTFAKNIDEKTIMETADIMVESGLLDCGYNYLVIDDCWALRERDENGKLVPDPEKFPHGMKYVADYVHSKGLKFGMYSCAGTLTCAGYPASYEHEFDDAASFAEWGVDFLKYDYCFRPTSIPGNILYKRMSIALKNCGRDILFSACSWGADNTREWIGETGANMWRTTGDIFENWKSIKELSLKGLENARYGSINCFPDMDMLVVGMYGKGHVGFAGCTDVEYRTHFSLWALLNSPLMIGCDIRDMNEATKNILMNKEVIAINQDPDCNVPFSIRRDEDQYCDVSVIAKMLSNGDYAIGIFNFTDENANKWNTHFTLEKLGLPESTGKTLEMKNLWTGETTVIKNGVFFADVEPHDCLLFRAKVIDK
ncbi:MAG: glycoside hydrolase family 27 protein [Clostridia bacterium]|nr:glycoside hydrolase family 27 protein [Clostridia bacterium]